MSHTTRFFSLLCCCFAGMAADGTPSTITIMTRNVDAGTDLGYLFAAVDDASFVQGMAATWKEVKLSNFQQRAARVASEVAATMPDLIALQEVTLWRSGPMMQPPATNILYDQLDQILGELNKRNLHYGVIAVQSEIDAEAPVPSAAFDLRMTDRDVILSRLDAPQSQFDLVNAQTHRYQAVYAFGNPILGEVAVPCGWITVDVTANGVKFRFVNTHLQAAVPGLTQPEAIQLAQADELLTSLRASNLPVVLAGDFNSNAEPGPEYTGTAQKIVSAGFVDTWKSAHPSDPGYTWPLFGEDQNSGPVVPNERIDLIFASPGMSVLSVDRTGDTPQFASDHAGLVVRLRLQ
jgi:endonuclease/exonuclease/phosphatase family metal-dependent hydrolase